MWKLNSGMAREILLQLEIAQDSRTLSTDEVSLKTCLKNALMLSSLKRTIARLRSRIGWLKEGETNTRFFHTHAWHRKRKIGRLVSEDGGGICTSHEDKASHVDDFYDRLLWSCLIKEDTIDLSALGVPTHDLSAFDSPFSENEVWDTIKQLPSDKAPALDGFTGAFYKSCWPIIKQDVMLAVWSRKFLNFDKMNNTFITLIPKTVGADCVKDFQPISLVRSIAKLVTKLLANRLAQYCMTWSLQFKVRS
jgi:hypothetical protein